MGPPQADLELSGGFLDLPLSEGEPEARFDLLPAEEPPSGPPTPTSTRASPPGTTGPLLPPGRARRWPWLLLALFALGLGGAAGYYLRPTPPVAALSVEILDFGEVRLGNRNDRLLVELRNLGQESLTITAAALEGEAMEEFAILTDGCSGQLVAADSGCLLRLAFAPASPGPSRGRLVIESNAVNGLQALPLIGAGVTPELRFEPARVDFGSFKVDVASPRATLRLANTGSTALALTRIGLSGLAAFDFVLLADGCGGRSLGPGERCTIDYHFVPTAEGLRRAKVEIASDAPALDSSPWLLGIGLPKEPLLRLDPERIEFDPRAVGDASRRVPVALHNDGDGPLEIEGISTLIAEIAQPGADAAGSADSFALSAEEAGFEVAADDCTGRLVPPGEKCDLEIVFRPRGEGETRAFFEIRHSAQERAHTLPVFGVGTTPHAFVEPLRLSFGEVPVEQPSAARSVRVVSSGSAALVIRDVAVEGADRRSFAPPVSNCTDGGVEPGGSCTVEVRFRPRRDGPHRAELVIRHNAGRGLHRLPLNGLGVSARLVVEPVRLDLGGVELSSERQGHLMLANSGRSGLEVRRIRLTGTYAAAFEVRSDQCSGETLGPRESCSVSVRFAPVRTGTHNATLKIDHTAAGSPTEISVSANATEPPVPWIRVDPEELDFEDRRLEERSPILTVTIENPGAGRLILQTPIIAGEYALDFRVVPGSCDGAEFVAPGARCTVGVGFTPSATGPRRAELVIRHNAEGGIERVALRGTGSLPPPVP